MNILHTVSEYYPSVGGMQEVVKQVSERLVKLGHSVTVATGTNAERIDRSINGVRVVDFNVKGNTASGYKGEVNNYRDFLLSHRFDVVTNFAAQQWATDIMLPLLDKISAAKVFVPTGFSGLYLPRYRQYFLDMSRFLHQFDMCVFLSDNYRDVNFAKAHNVQKRILIPNGAGEDEFLSEPLIDIRKKFCIPQEHLLIITVGSHTGLKGHGDAIRMFGKADIVDATFMIIGNEYWNGCGKSCRFRQKLTRLLPRYKRNRKKIITCSLSREETIAAYKQADLFLFTSNIECSPIVLFECMASKTAFLTTDVGNAAEIVGWSGSGLVLPTEITRQGFSKARIPESTDVLEKVIANPMLRTQMQEAGFKVWQKKFTWEKITVQYENLYRSLVMRQ